MTSTFRIFFLFTINEYISFGLHKTVAIKVNKEHLLNIAYEQNKGKIYKECVSVV
jgi:hypothetical protein